MYRATLLVLVCLMVTQARCEHGQYAFVIGKLQSIKCISNPVNDVCPVDHKVPNLIQNIPWMNSTTIRQVLNTTSHQLGMAGGSVNCTTANAMFQCSKLIYTCKTNLSYVYLDSDRAYRRCMTVRQECNNTRGTLNLDELFNCTKYENATVRFDKPEACMEYPDVENDTCPKRNYKVPTYANFTSLVEIHKKAQKMLKDYNVTENCTNDVLKAICDIGSPACTRDETYAASLLGKKKCLEIMSCVESANNTNFTNSAMKLCQKLPDEDTAKNISIHNIENPKTGMPAIPGITAPPTTAPPTTAPPTTEPNTTMESTIQCCGASRLSAMGHIFVVFIIWLFLHG